MTTSPDHIGWDLARAYSLWAEMFRTRMVGLGYDWYGEARGRLMQFIGPSGISQAELVDRSTHSKQAIQQMVDALVAEGVLRRVPDPKDARRKCVMLSDQGLRFQADGARVKAEIEQDLAARIGSDAFAAVKSGLHMLLDVPEG